MTSRSAPIHDALPRSLSGACSDKRSAKAPRAITIIERGAQRQDEISGHHAPPRSSSEERSDESRCMFPVKRALLLPPGRDCVVSPATNQDIRFT